MFEKLKQKMLEHREQRLAKELIKKLSQDADKFNELSRKTHETRVQAALTIIGIYDTFAEGELITAEMLPEMNDEDLDEIIDYGVEQLRRLR